MSHVPRSHQLIEQIRIPFIWWQAAWNRRSFRQAVAASAVLWMALCLLCCLSIRGVRPFIDAPSGIAAVASSLMDAMSIVHHFNRDERIITLPNIVIAVDAATPMAGLSAAAIFVCVCYAAGGKSSTPHLAALLPGAVAVVFLTNVLLLLIICTTSAACRADLSPGLGGLPGMLLRVVTAAGLLFCLTRGLDWASSAWTYRLAVAGWRNTEELPVRMSRKGRLEAALLVAVCGSVIALWGIGCGITPETTITSYRQIADHGLRDGDLPTAALAIDRILQLDPDAPAHRLLHARFRESEGDLDAAEAMVRELVESGGRQFAPAHRWLADAIAGKSAADADTESGELTASVSQLTQSTGLDLNDIDAHIALAEAYLARRSPEQAIRELEQVVKRRPELRLTLARLLVIVGEPGRAREQGESARDEYQEQVHVYPLAREPRVRLAASLIFLEEFDNALAVLLSGWNLTQDLTYHRAVSATYVIWHDTATASAAPKAMLIELLKKSLEFNPENAEALRRLTVMATQESHEGPAIELLTRALDGRPIPACVHCILGTNAFRHGRVKNAIRHLEEAYRLDPTNVETLNNLACVLSRSEPADLDRALQLADEAVRRRPNLASPRETRGQILAKLGDWSRAIADLENAMQVIRDNPEIHATLAEAYAEIGDQNLAAEHRRLAGELRHTQ